MSRAVLYDATGGPEVLRVGEVADPEPGPGQVAVTVAAAGLNPFDAKVRGGVIPMDLPFPRRLGSDFAGAVAAVGEGAAYWDGSPVEAGDEVIGWGPGALAERVVTASSQIVRRPARVSVEVGGGLFVAGGTAVSCLTTVPVGAGDRLLVGGAAGAVGLVVSQLAVAAGASVVGTASPRNHDLLAGLGVTPVAYGAGLLDQLAGLGPFTAVIDCHGRDALDAGVALGVPKDRIAGIAGYAAIAELGVLDVERSARTAPTLARLVDDLAAGRLVLPVADTYPLDAVQEAFRALEGGHAAGKIVLLP